MHVRLGQIAWVGNRFLASEVPSPYNLKFRVEGELLEWNGRPSELFVSYSTGNASTDINARWRIKYFYERELSAAFFPARIKAFSVRDAAEVEMDDFEILKLPVGRAALASRRV